MYKGFEYDREMTIRFFKTQLEGHCKSHEEVLVVLSNLMMYFANYNKKDYEELKATQSFYEGIVDGAKDLD